MHLAKVPSLQGKFAVESAFRGDISYEFLAYGIKFRTSLKADSAGAATDTT